MTAKIEIVGFVARDPKTIEVKDTKISLFSVASTVRENTTFFDVKVAHDKINFDALDLKKGDKVIIQGGFSVEKQEYEGTEYIRYKVNTWSIFKIHYNKKPKNKKPDKVEKPESGEETTPF